MGSFHAKLSASASERWMNCPGSVAKAESLPKKGSSPYARLGTAAHKLGEHCLTNNISDVSLMLGHVIRMTDGGKGDDAESVSIRPTKGPIDAGDFLVDDDMVEAVQIYVDTVAEKIAEMDNPDIYLEDSLTELEDLHPDLGGTADWFAIEEFRSAKVIDYKHGSGVVVEVVDNTQLMIYALGVYLKDDSIDEIEVTIVQPRAPHADGPVRSVIYTSEDMKAFIKVLKTCAGNTQKLNAILSAGTWCRFCPALDDCEEAKRVIAKMAQLDFNDPPPVPGEKYELKRTFTNKELAKLLPWLPVVDSWVKMVAVAAQSELEAGREIPDYKLVEKTGNRIYQGDTQDLINELAGEFMMDEEAFMNLPEPQILSPAQIEKVNVGDKDDKKLLKDIVAKYTVKPKTGYTMVHISDKREAVSLINEDFDDDAPLID